MSVYNGVRNRSCRHCGKAFLGSNLNCSNACERAQRAAGYRKLLASGRAGQRSRGGHVAGITRGAPPVWKRP